MRLAPLALLAFSLALPAAAEDAHGGHAGMAGTEIEALTGILDADFLLAMIPHHEGAVLMAEAVMAQADGDPDVRALAEAIIAAQNQEIDWMRDWLRRNGHGAALDASKG